MPPPLRHLTLVDLPDELLGLITAAAYAAGGHAGLFSACRRLARVGPASLTALALRRPSNARLSDDAHDAIRRALAADPTRTDRPAAVAPHLVNHPALIASAAAGGRFLRRATRVTAVSLHAGDRLGSACAACVVAAAAAGGGGWAAPPPRPASPVAAVTDTVYAALLMPEVRAVGLAAFAASGAVVAAAGAERLTARRLRALHLQCIPVGAWAAVVAPLLAHHGGTLTELTLGGVPNDCWPSPTNVARAVAAPARGMPALRALALVAVSFGRRNAAAVAAACPSLTSLAVDGAMGRGASRAVDARALPGLARLSWIAATESSVDYDLGPLFAGRTLDAATVGGHFRLDEEPPLVDPVVSALTAAPALPTELDLLTAGFFDSGNLRRLVGASRSVARLARLRMAIDDNVSPAGLSALRRLPALTSLCLHVTHGLSASLFHPWPCHGLTHLGVVPWASVPPHVLTAPLLAGLAASPAASTLRSLALTCRPLEAASSADALGRLTRLRRLYYRLVDGGGVPYASAAAAAAAAAPMVSWMRARLPRVTAVAGVPPHWAGPD